MTLKDYLTLSQKMRIEPSFFHTLPYLEFAGAEAWKNAHWAWITSEGWIMFNPLMISSDPKTLGNEAMFFPKGDIWCASSDNIPHPWYQKQFLDWEYIFDPADFNDMSGGKWNTFRKNVRKWPRENPEHVYTDELDDWGALSVLMGEWLEGRADKAEDAELMMKYMFSSRQDVGKKFMYNDSGELVGVNVWDFSWKYINYRLCIVKPGERFLDEFMRYQFYRDSDIIETGMLVNDGGILGREGLERFKDKMNPLYRRQRCSLIKSNRS